MATLRLACTTLGIQNLARSYPSLFADIKLDVAWRDVVACGNFSPDNTLDFLSIEYGKCRYRKVHRFRE